MLTNHSYSRPASEVCLFSSKNRIILDGRGSKEHTISAKTEFITYCFFRRCVHLMVTLLRLMLLFDMQELTGQDETNPFVTPFVPAAPEKWLAQLLHMPFIVACKMHSSDSVIRLIHTLVHVVYNNHSNVTY